MSGSSAIRGSGGYVGDKISDEIRAIVHDEVKKIIAPTVNDILLPTFREAVIPMVRELTAVFIPEMSRAVMQTVDSCLRTFSDRGLQQLDESGRTRQRIVDESIHSSVHGNYDEQVTGETLMDIPEVTATADIKIGGHFDDEV